MKRIISLLAVMAVMAAMVVATAMPAFAKGKPPCKGNQSEATVDPAGSLGDDNQNGVVCINNKGQFSDDRV